MSLPIRSDDQKSALRHETDARPFPMGAGRRKGETPCTVLPGFLHSY